MKKILLFAFTVLIFGLSASAQCDLALSGLKLTVSPQQVACKLKFDLSFYIDNNGGNKQIYINLWNGATQYNIGSGEHNWAANNAKMPSYNQMDGPSGGNGPLAVVGINVVTNDFVPYYSQDNTNISYINKRLVKGTSITQTLITDPLSPNFDKTFFVLSNLEMDIPGRANTLALKGNIWGSQVQLGNIGAQPSIHCYDNNFDFTVAGEVKINAASNLDCGTPERTFQLFLDATGNYNVTYKAYVDMNGDGDITGDPTAFTSGTIPVSDVNPLPSTAPDYNSGVIEIPAPYGTDDLYKKKRLIVVVSYNNTIGQVEVEEILQNGCIPLPVHFRSFNASRTTSSNVAITWTTASEQNSKGFNVQKNVGGEWKTIAFVFSQADGGNSSSDLSYSFKDVNSEKGITQYRIQQVDLDGMAKYSDIKAIKGESIASKIVVYPNPSVDGKLNVVFEDNNVRDIQVNDMQGRIIKSYKGITNNILVIEKLTSGFYTIKVTNRNTAASSVEKVVVK